MIGKGLNVLHFRSSCALVALIFIAGINAQLVYARDEIVSNDGTEVLSWEAGRQARLIRQYVLFNYRRLANDLLVGEGVFLANLFYLLGIGPHDYESTSKIMREMLIETPRTSDFAVKLCRQFCGGGRPLLVTPSE